MAWDSVFEAIPDPTEDISLGASRITTTKADMRDRLETETNFGTVTAGNTDDGRLNPGAARAFSGTATPTALKSFNGTNPVALPNASSPNLGANDEGRLWLDENTAPAQLKWWDGTAWSPVVVGGVATSASPYRNALINGGFEVWQRGFAAAAPVGNQYWADRWFCRDTSGATAITQGRVSVGLPTGCVSRFGIQIVGGVGTTTVDLVQRIESHWIPYIRGTISVSFMCRYTGGTVTPSLLLGDPTVSDDFTVVTNRLTQAHPGGAVADGRLSWPGIDISGYANLANGLEVRLRFPAGSLDNVAENVVINDAQLSKTSVVTAFELRPLPVELELCKRYYRKTFPYATPAAQNSGVLTGALVQYIHSSGDGVGAQWRFEPHMRATPTITLYNPTAASSTWDEDGGADTQPSGVVTNATGQTGAHLTAITAGNNGSYYLIHASAEAEL